MLNNNVSILDIVNTTNTVSNQVETVQNQISDVYTFKTSNVIKVGSLNDNNCVLSGFLPDTYAIIRDVNLTNPFEIQIKVKTNDLSIHHADYNQQVFLATNGNDKYLTFGTYIGNLDLDFNIGDGSNWLSDGSTNITLSSNTIYWFKLIFDGTKYSCLYSTNGTDFSIARVINSNTTIPKMDLNLGVARMLGYPFLGEIDLNECYIKINGHLYWEGTTVSKSSILNILYPIGSIYIGTMAVCPLQTLGLGTWQQKTTRFLVEKKEATASDSSWYNLYSDGYIEQGGIANYPQLGVGYTDWTDITFSKTMKDTNYNTTTQICIDGGESWYIKVYAISKNTSTMRVGWANGTAAPKQINREGKFDWTVTGYTSSTTSLKQWERIS